MSRKYIRIGMSYVYNDREGFKCYIKYFFSGLAFSRNVFLNKIYNIIVVYIIYLLIRLKVFKSNLLEEIKIPNSINNGKKFLVIKTKQGSNYGNIYLIKNRKLEIYKQFNSRQSYFKSKKYYNVYLKNKSNILLPNHKFDDEFLIQKISLVSGKSLCSLIQTGDLSLGEALIEFVKIKREICTLYGNGNKQLISGDFTTNNIYVSDTQYYLIDYSESFLFNARYDIYTLLRSIFADFRLLKYNSQNKISSIKSTNILKILECDNNELNKIENKFFNKMREKNEKK